MYYHIHIHHIYHLLYRHISLTMQTDGKNAGLSTKIIPHLQSQPNAPEPKIDAAPGDEEIYSKRGKTMPYTSHYWEIIGKP